MEGSLTDCLVRLKEDSSQLKKIRDYLQKNAETLERCSFTWRTIEALNSILAICTQQSAPEAKLLDTILDSFYYLARNSTDNSVWDNFGFELGIICVKILSAIERTDIFEVLFYKLLSIITIICEYNSGVWKAAGRQILNALINKKFSFHYLEGILKSYVKMIRNVESSVRYDFSSHNLSLLKTFSMVVQRVGDFEIQSDIVEMIFLHLSNDTKLMSDFFTTTENKLFQSLQFTDFERDCRLFLNALNKPQRELERKVYSVCCNVLYLGGCSLKAPVKRNYIWIDANKDTERLSIKCRVDESNENRIIYVQFSDLVNVHFDNDKAEGKRYLIIRTKSLMDLHKDFKNNDICFVAENAGLFDFVKVLETVIRQNKKQKLEMKASKTMDYLVIDIRNSNEVQDNAITSSERHGVDHVVPEVFSLSEKISRSTVDSFEMQRKSSRPLKLTGGQTAPVRKAEQEQSTIFKSQQLSPHPFAESLNKHLGLDSPEPKHTFEDSVQTIEILRRGTTEKCHKLSRSPNKIFNMSEANEANNFTFVDENKENHPLLAVVQQKIKTCKRKSPNNTPKGSPTCLSLGSGITQCLNSKKNKSEGKLSNTQSQDYFRGVPSILFKKKPSLPKLRRTKKATYKELHAEDVSKNNVRLIEETQNHSFFSNSEATEQKNGTPHKILPQLLKMEMREPLKKQKVFSKKTDVEDEKMNEKQKRTQIKHKKSSEKNREKKVGTKKGFTEETNRQQSEEGRPKKQRGLTFLTHQYKTKQENGRGTAQAPQAKTNTRPSLLDPNGYAYKRWCKPTTSERSNFWLKKLKTLESLKTDASVFEFSEDSDRTFGRNNNKRKTLYSRPSRRTVKNKQTSLRQAKEFLKKTPPRDKPKEEQQTRPPEEGAESPASFSHTDEFAKYEGPLNSVHSESLSKGDSTGSSRERSSLYEDLEQSAASVQDEEQDFRSKKRERSQEDSSTAKTYLKKKPKNSPSAKISPSVLRLRLQRAEERDRRQTDRVIQIVNETMDSLMNRLQAKEGEGPRSHSKAVETASAAADTEIHDLSLRAKRTKRAILYFEAGCLVSDLCKTLHDRFSRVRDSLKALRDTKNTLKTLDRIGNRLTSLIKSEMQRTIKNEWASQRDLLLKCAKFGDRLHRI